MTDDRHPLDGADYWREREADDARLLEALATGTQVDLKARLSVELELGLVRGLFGGDPAPRAEHLTMAMDCGCALALARVCARRGSGFAVELRRASADAGEDYIRLKAEDNGFGWPDWLDAFALALLGGDAQSLAVLATAGCVDACALSFAQVDRFWPLLCGGLAALWQRDPAAPALLDDAAGLLRQVSVMEPARAAALIAPLVPLAQAVVAGDQAAAARCAAVALHARRDWFTAEPNGSRDPDGLFDLPVSALLAEAERRGLGPLPDSAYRLAPFARPLPVRSLMVVYPRLAILDAVEAEWLMQNEGFARHDRSTVLQAADGRLVARYRAYDAPGIPLAELELELLDARKDRIFDGTHAPPALDLGELLQRAEQLAGTPRTGPDGRPVYDLAQAVEAMDLALAWRDTMPGGFDPASLHSAVGERIWREEPGRLGRERMLVYRNALARQAGLAAREEGPGPAQTPPPAAAPGAPGDARAQAIELAEKMTPLVLPILQAIALGPDDSAIRALLPRDGDFALAFTGDAVEAARAHYESEWPRQLAEGVRPSVDPDWRIEAHLAPAGLLAGDNVLSRPFPGGYRQIAGWLDPRRVWVCWRYLPPGADAGIAMNGLVWLDDHWAWFPKPYRLVGRLNTLRPATGDKDR